MDQFNAYNCPYLRYVSICFYPFTAQNATFWPQIKSQYPFPTPHPHPWYPPGKMHAWVDQHFITCTWTILAYIIIGSWPDSWHKEQAYHISIYLHCSSTVTYHINWYVMFFIHKINPIADWLLIILLYIYIVSSILMGLSMK